MSDIVLYCLISNNSIIFGPRKYYKPAFLKFAEKLELTLDFPDSMTELESYDLGNNYVLVREDALETMTVEDKTVPAVEEVTEELTEENEVPEQFILKAPIQSWTLEETFNIDNEPLKATKPRKKK